MWTQDTVIKLIKEYRKREILWNPSYPNYFNKILKARAWKEIAQEMDVPERAVKTKVESFLAQLRRERAKMIKMTKRGLQFTSSWYGFEHLRFLLIKRKYRRPLFSEVKNDNNNSETDLQVPQTNNLSNQSTLKRPTEKVLTPKKKSVDTENRLSKKSVYIVNRMKKSVDTENLHINSVDTDNRMIKSACSIQAATSNTVKDVLAKSETDSSVIDTDQIYANFIASKFRIYSQQTKNVLHYKISHLLFQADTGVFDDDQAYATPQQETNANQTVSRQPRANESDSPSSSPENKRTRGTSLEDQTPVSLKIEDSSDSESEDPLNADYEDLI